MADDVDRPDGLDLGPKPIEHRGYRDRVRAHHSRAQHRVVVPHPSDGRREVGSADGLRLRNGIHAGGLEGRPIEGLRQQVARRIGEQDEA
jgi:hypothetical protein